MENLAKLGIDFGSMLIYFVNYGLLLGALGYLVYPKIIKIIDERRDKIEDNLNESARLRKEMIAQSEDSKKEKESLMNDLKEDRDLLKRELQEKRVELLSKMEEEKTKLLEEAREQIKKEKDEIVDSAKEQILGMVERVVIKVLSNQVPDDVVRKSVNEAWKSHK